MTPDTSPRANAPDNSLLEIAARRVAAAVKGCARRLRPSGLVGLAADTFDMETVVPQSAIALFGPPILEGWLQWLELRPEAEVEEAVRKLATMLPQAARQYVLEQLAREAPDAEPPDRAVAGDYLAALTSSARETLVAEPGSAKLTLPRQSNLRQLMHRLLPANVPPFSVGSEVPGTPYILDELLGQGGFGAVYRARNRFEQRAPPRALKFCLHPDLVLGLHREQDLLDRLMQASQRSSWSKRIVAFFGHSLDCPTPFLVYEYVPGGSLTSRLMATRRKLQRNLDTGEVLRLVRQVAEGLAFAHRLGLVHRDIKPANILVSREGIKLADFGLGGIISSRASRESEIGFNRQTGLQTQEQVSLFRGGGTPLYMAPEQRRGDAPDPRHDVFSLGVMWYQLLVGDVSQPLDPGWDELLMEEFDVPRSHVLAIERCVGYFKKRPEHGEELLKLIDELRSEASAARGSGSASSSAELPVLAAAKDASPAQPTTPSPAGREPSTLPTGPPAVPSAGEAFRLGVHEQRVNSVAFSPDGFRIASTGHDGAVRVCDLPRQRELRSFRPGSKPLHAAVWSPSGLHVAAGGPDQQLRVFDVPTGQLVRSAETGSGIAALAWSSHGKWLAIGLDSGTVLVTDARDGRVLRRLSGHKQAIHTMLFSADLKQLCIGSHDGAISTWDLQAGQQAVRFDFPAMSMFATTPDSERWLSAGQSGLIQVWNPKDGTEVRKFDRVGRALQCVAVSPDGRRALSGGWDNVVREWDIASGKCLATLEGHRNWVTSVSYSPRERQAASAGLDGFIIVWNLSESGKPGRGAGQ